MSSSSSSSSSNIRVYVQWKEPTVFAGEDVECTITFKNIAPLPGAEGDGTRNSRHSGSAPNEERQRKVTPLHSSSAATVSRNSFLSPQVRLEQARGHRATLSLNVPSSSKPWSPSSGPSNYNGALRPEYKHGRSVSIVSIGSGTIGEDTRRQATAGTAKRPARGHGRSASLQVMPGRSIMASPPPVLLGTRSVTQPSQLYEASTAPALAETQSEPQLPTRPGRRSSGIRTAPNTPALSNPRKFSDSPIQAFRFPGTPPPRHSSPPDPMQPSGPGAGPRMNASQFRSQSPRLPEQRYNGQESMPPISRILSTSSMNGTPRSSVDFYSMSNNSSETLASEYLPQSARRGSQIPMHARQKSHTPPTNHQRLPEVLMMGYAQIVGSFTLDGSLVNQAPFEEVKRKGVLGGQGGGGVVGVERSKKESGLFGALGWGSIGESLGGLLGGEEPSSIREMRNQANTKTIPLLSTPQSILFVDLRLAPGESRAYTYCFTLPRGLPPSHKGRAMKVSYHLTIGTQRPGPMIEQQQVRHVDVPFRVFGGVNSQGEIMGHDLMAPYIILQDQARTWSVDASSTVSGAGHMQVAEKSKVSDSSLDDFLSYVDNLLDTPRQNSSIGLLSPSEAGPRRPSRIEEPSSMKESIDFAILRSNISSGSNQSSNRFEISRSGRRVAVIMLGRPAYRLGETISAVIDFVDADIPCYFAHVSLETCEKVDPAIAMRSSASIHRATRKIHAAYSANALFARRLAFSPSIPHTATPEFITSGVSLEWKLRVEFVTPRLGAEHAEDEPPGHDLLEEIAKDDRGTVLVAVERLLCESFEVAVPVRVYGAVARGSESVGGEELSV
ncbi:Golgi membrane exchange factor (Ric1p-Rgp1p) subunit [Cryomyces antarcticus]|nr:Golgi membrane exchange factor (Ric1p-Rgp1p) subunit [Cryomyces antarcticus]